MSHKVWLTVNASAVLQRSKEKKHRKDKDKEKIKKSKRCTSAYEGLWTDIAPCWKTNKQKNKFEWTKFLPKKKMYISDSLTDAKRGKHLND